MARRKRGWLGTLLVVGVLALAVVGGYTIYSSPTGQKAGRVMKAAGQAGVQAADKVAQEAKK